MLFKHLFSFVNRAVEDAENSASTATHRSVFSPHVVERLFDSSQFGVVGEHRSLEIVHNGVLPFGNGTFNSISQGDCCWLWHNVCIRLFCRYKTSGLTNTMYLPFSESGIGVRMSPMPVA